MRAMKGFIIEVTHEYKMRGNLNQRFNIRMNTLENSWGIQLTNFNI